MLLAIASAHVGIVANLAASIVRSAIPRRETRALRRVEERFGGTYHRAPPPALVPVQLRTNPDEACQRPTSSRGYRRGRSNFSRFLNLSPGLVATLIAIANFVGFLAMGFWGWVGDRIGRRWSMIIPSAMTVLVAPLYLLTNDFTLIVVGFALHALFPIYSQLPSYLCERFPTEVRATASAFCYHQGAIFGGLVAPVLTYIAVTYGVGLGVSMMAGTAVGVVSNICALLLSPETKGKVLAADLVLA